MHPPEAPLQTGNRPPAVSLRLQTLKKRADFLRTARGRKQVTPGFVLQARARDETPLIRVGFTASKKVGGAVARNRAKRRLRALARAVLPRHGQPGWDYVLVARRDQTATRPFADLQTDLENALARLGDTTDK